MGVSQDFNLLGEKILELVPSIDIRYKISMLYLGKNYYAKFFIQARIVSKIAFTLIMNIEVQII